MIFRKPGKYSTIDSVTSQSFLIFRKSPVRTSELGKVLWTILCSYVCARQAPELIWPISLALAFCYLIAWNCVIHRDAYPEGLQKSVVMELANRSTSQETTPPQPPLRMLENPVSLPHSKKPATCPCSVPSQSFVNVSWYRKFLWWGVSSTTPSPQAVVPPLVGRFSVRNLSTPHSVTTGTNLSRTLFVPKPTNRNAVKNTNINVSMCTGKNDRWKVKKSKITP
jgi:hypothetical protein